MVHPTAHNYDIPVCQGWQVLPMPGFTHGLNPGLNRVGQNPQNPVTVGKTGQNWVKRD